MQHLFWNAFTMKGRNRTKKMRPNALAQACFVMKLMIVFTFFIVFRAHAYTSAQAITISFKNAPLENVFLGISKQTNYNFVYNNNVLKNTKSVDVNVTGASVEEVLRICLKNQPVSFKIVDRTIIIVRPEPPAVVPKQAAPLLETDIPPIPISGKVNLNSYKASIESILKSIEFQTEYSFIYQSDLLLKEEKINILAENADIEYVMDEILKNTKLTYLKIAPKLITIVKKGASVNSFNITMSWVLKGKILNVDGQPIFGASVSIKGTSRGTYTQEEGTFMLEVESATDSIVISAVGYKTKTIVVGKEKEITIILEPDIEKQKMDEVVITAFGRKQRKEAVVGSVTSVSIQDLTVPSSNLTTAFAGKIAGMISFQRSGEPGADNASFFIRGITTFGYNKQPLILIDNMEVSITDLARLNVDEIEGFSVMKDATATALYGARGANGVILVSTKQGVEGRAIISARIEKKISSPTRNIELADPIAYMRLNNEAVLTRTPLGTQPYTNEKIDKTIAKADPYLYPAVDWRKELLKNNTVNTRANLDVQGGGKVARYMVSGYFAQDNGILNVPKVNNYNNNIKLNTSSLRSNVVVNLFKNTQLIVRLSGTFDDYKGPIQGGQQVYNDIMHTNPVLFPPYFEPGEKEKYLKHIMFGNYGNGGYLNPYAEMVKGYKHYSRSNLYAQVELKQNLDAITKGLSFRGLVNTTRNSYFDVIRQYAPFYYTISIVSETKKYKYELLNPDGGTEYLDYNEGAKRLSSVFYLESALDYSRTFKEKHDVSAFAIYIMRNRLDGNAGSLITSLPFRNIGVSGRATYGYDKRYYGEFNFGYNASERFSANKKFGFFPSVGMAWVISNESFFRPVKRIVTNLKLRGTYGLVGNDAIGSPDERFFFLSNIRMVDRDRGASFGQDFTYAKNGISITNYANPDITWEIAYKKNLAVEASLLGKMTLIAEFYSEKRKNILMERVSIPTSMGLAAPIKANIGEVKSNGIDISLDHNQKLSQTLWVRSRVNFTYATNKINAYEEPDYNEFYLRRKGYSTHQRWGYIADRLFIDDEEVRNSPLQGFGRYAGGDIKYQDVNGDGRITSLDRVPIGYPSVPEIIYGFGSSVGNKSFDFSFFFQGMGRTSLWIDPVATSPFTNNTQLLKVYADDHWSEDNRNTYALWPRLSTNIVNNNVQTSTWFMRNGSLLRLKQVELGYTLPSKLVKRVGLSKFRAYVVASNLLSFSQFKLWDVEQGGSGFTYPVQRVYSMGLNMSF